MSAKVYAEKILNVPVFSFNDCCGMRNGSLSFYMVKFFLPELKKYDEKVVDLNGNGDIKIWNDDLSDIVYKGNLGMVKSFRDKLNVMYRYQEQEDE